MVRRSHTATTTSGGQTRASLFFDIDVAVAVADPDAGPG